MVAQTATHFINHVIPAATEYWQAEMALSQAMDSGDADLIATAKVTAWRKAAEVSVAIDGLTDRAHRETGATKTAIRTAVATLCTYNGGPVRDGSFDRVRGAANAYKHQTLNDATLPITSDADILTVGLGYGLDGWGVGKMGGTEVIIRQTDGRKFKFLGDVPAVLRGWAAYIVAQGGALAPGIVFGPTLINP